MSRWTRNPLLNPDVPTRPTWGREAKSEFRIHVGLRTRSGRRIYHPDYVLQLIQKFRPWPVRRGQKPPRPMEGATIWTGWGLWKGEYEPTMVISTYVWPAEEASMRQYALQLAVYLAEALNQESVLVMEFPAGMGVLATPRSRKMKAADRKKRKKRPVRRIAP